MSFSIEYDLKVYRMLFLSWTLNVFQLYYPVHDSIYSKATDRFDTKFFSKILSVGDDSGKPHL